MSMRNREGGGGHHEGRPEFLLLPAGFRIQNAETETGQESTRCPLGQPVIKDHSVSTGKPLTLTESALLLTCGVGEVEDAGGRVQQVGAAGRQVAGDGHDGHAVPTLLGTHNAVVLRLTHAAIAAEGREREPGTLDLLRQKLTLLSKIDFRLLFCSSRHFSFSSFKRKYQNECLFLHLESV